jgi:hypothetical protein
VPLEPSRRSSSQSMVSFRNTMLASRLIFRTSLRLASNDTLSSPSRRPAASGSSRCMTQRLVTCSKAILLLKVGQHLWRALPG